MGFIKEPENVDFSMRSTPWTEEELKELSEFIRKSKAAYLAREKRRVGKKATKAVVAAK